MRNTTHLVSRARALAEKVMEAARAPWTNKAAELRRGLAGLPEFDRHVMLRGLELETDESFVSWAMNQLSVEDAHLRKRSTTLAGGIYRACTARELSR